MINISTEEQKIAVIALVISFIALFVAQLIKFITWSIGRKRLYFRALISTGGWPSSHSALVASLSFSILALYGYKISMMFVVALVTSVIVVHDAMGVRLEASKHAEMLNDINEELSDRGMIPSQDKPLKEMLGHKPFEVLSGILLGFAIAFIGCLIV